MSSLPSWLFWALGSALFASLTAILGKLGVRGLDPDFATLIRSFVIIACLSLFVAITGKWSDPRQLPGKTILFLVFSGIATGLSWACYFRALKAGEASKVAPVDKLSLVLVCVFAVIFLGERPSLKDWTGIGLVAAGVLLLALKR